MRFKWLDDLFAESAAPNDRPLRDLSRFDIGVCPGCRGLRVQSLQELEAALDSACGADHAVLIDVVTDADAYPPITVFEPN